MAASTADCTAFIVDFQKRNPSLEDGRFGMEQAAGTMEGEPMDEEGIAAFARLHDPKAWKRIYKRRADHEENVSPRGARLRHFVEGDDGHKGPTGTASLADAATIRGFMFDRLDGQIAYEVIEMKDGTLLLGDYIGD